MVMTQPTEIQQVIAGARQAVEAVRAHGVIDESEPRQDGDVQMCSRHNHVIDRHGKCELCYLLSGKNRRSQKVRR
jgi:hypothetical protein